MLSAQVLLLSLGVGCGLRDVLFSNKVACGSTLYGFRVRGQVFLSDSSEPLSGGLVGGRLLAEGVEIGDGGNVPPHLPPADDGSFEVEFIEGAVEFCCELPCTVTPPDPPERTRPDQFEAVVRIGTCEERFLIEINEDTVVDLSFPEHIIELKEPILVGSCAE